MKKLLTLTAAVLASFSLWAQTELFSFTVTSSTTAIGSYAATGGTAALSGGAHASGGTNEITVDAQTYYKFNSSTKWTFTLADGTFAVDDVISLKAASATSNKTGKGFKLAGSIAVTGDFPASTANTLTYTVKADDGIAGNSSFTLERNDSDIKFGTIVITRPAAIVDPVASVTIAGPTRGTKDYASTFSATTDVKADAYQWFVNDVEQTGATAKTFEFTPTAAGDYNIVCKARNANNATDEWIASSPITFKALNSLCGEIIKATLTSGSAATVTGLIGGTADVSLSSTKKMDKGKYFGITLKSGNFQEGDTVVITMTTAGTNYPCLFGDKEKTKLLYLATESSSDLEYKIVLPAEAADLNSLYLVRDADDATYKWNPVLASMAVIRPMATKSVVESLTGLSIDGEALDAASLAALQSAHNFGTAVQYVNAPTMVFTKHVVITYEDDSQVESDKEIEVLATDLGDSFEARATINGIEYIINTGKATSFVVTYMDGTTELGTENVATGSAPANYADFQNKSLATFIGWYSDSELENAVADMSAEVINAAKTYYAKFEDAYATSINFEKAVMENGKGYGIIAQLGTLGYSTGITGSLDSLDNSKADKLRNYAYLGLKVKQAGAMLDFRLAAGNTVKIKFGYIATTPQVSIDGGAYADMTITDKVYAHTATANEMISIKMANGNAVVFQQIMIGEELQAPELFAINCAEAENGTVAAPYKLGIPEEKVTLTVTPAEGYQIASVTLDGDVLVADGDVYSFDMPAKDVAVAATFSVATAIDNTDAAVKATKVLRDGQVLILRDGKSFNALGVEVK